MFFKKIFIFSLLVAAIVGCQKEVLVKESSEQISGRTKPETATALIYFADSSYVVKTVQTVKANFITSDSMTVVTNQNLPSKAFFADGVRVEVFSSTVPICIIGGSSQHCLQSSAKISLSGTTLNTKCLPSGVNINSNQIVIEEMDGL